MRGWRLRVLGWLPAAAVLASAACGGDEEPDAPSAAAGGTAAPGAAGSGDGAGPRPRADAPAPRGADAADPVRAEVARLADLWRNSEDRSEVERAVAELAAGGEKFAAVLADWLAGEDPELRDRATELLPRMGRAAVAPLLALLDGPREPRKRAVAMLVRLTHAWRGEEIGVAVCRALAAALADPDVAVGAIDALRAARPAAAAVAADLARLWAGSDDASSVAEILQELGTDAAPAAPVALAALAGDDEDRRAEAVKILAAIAGAAPEALPRLAALLGDEDAERRLAAATVLAAWGDAAAPQAALLATLLADPDERVRSAAATALGGMPGAAPRFARELVRAAFESEDASLYEAGEAVDRLARQPDFAAALLRMLPGLSHREMVCTRNALDRAGADLAPAIEALASHADPDFRGMALEPWSAPGAVAALRPLAVRLLDDPDPGVRSYAAERAAAWDAAPDGRIREVAMALRDASDPSVRASAVTALAWISRRDASVVAALLEALDDDFLPVRVAAIEGLARDDTPLPGAHRPAVEAVAEGLFERHDVTSSVRALLRFEGGAEVLIEDLRNALRHTTEGPAQDHPGRVVEAIRVLGPRAASLRPLVEAWDPEDNPHAARALAAISRDEVAAALLAETGSLAPLLALGPAGRRVVPLRLGRLDEEELPPYLAEAAPARLGGEALAAARTEDGLPEATAWRVGAARLARVLPLPEALAVLDAVVTSKWREPRQEALESLAAIERASPGTVPVAAFVRFLADDDEGCREPAFEILWGLGARARAAVPALRAARSSEHVADRVLAAIALWRVTGVPEEALVALRPILANPRLASVFTPWGDVGDALSELALGPDDRDLLLRALPQATSDHIRLSLVRGVVPLGPAAAPAVPTLRSYLSADFCGRGDPDEVGAEVGQTTCRALAAIGGAARAAIPDLHAWIAATGDPTGAGRAAVAAVASSR